MAALGTADFGVTTFFGSIHPNDKCGANGLPLTPNSVKILGKFRYLTTLDHPQLCIYIDIVRGKHERLIVVTDHYQENLVTYRKSGKLHSEAAIIDLTYHVLKGLAYLNTKKIVHHNLSPENILYTPEGKVKLSKYGLYYMTESGSAVAFPIGLPKYQAPEEICQGLTSCKDISVSPAGPKVDVWALGLILFEVITGHEVWPELTIPEILRKIVCFIKSDDTEPLDILAKEHNVEDKVNNLSENIIDFLRKCLTVSPAARHSPGELLQHHVFKQLALREIPYKNGFQLFSAQLRCKDLELPSLEDEDDKADEDEDHLAERSKMEVYYLWRLAGGDLETALRRAGLIKTWPPVTLLSNFVSSDGEMFGQKRDRSVLLDNTVVTLSLEQLRQRLSDIDPAAYYPLLEDEYSTGVSLPSSPSSVDLSDTASLPLNIRERDVEYQFHRIILYDRLLKAYPFKRAHIWKEARVDIPPLVRAHVWAALLEVEGDVELEYESIDKETSTPTDRQIEVDIPRCHQYDELLSSPEAHRKFKRVLKAWVTRHPEYVYWQGLDSLSAPFLLLNFNNEALAYACLAAFIPKYLNKFFMKDNSAVIQEYLAVFTHLIAYHDPELSNHLEGIGFIPDLYAIPWFLTMYAHVFPLHKIVHLWDTLLLGNSSFPLCIGVAILQQLRDRLLSFGFNECILLFSDMPEIDIERCVQDSIKVFCSTPKSTAYRQHAKQSKKAARQESRPNVSYYSRDYHEQPTNDLSMEPISIDDLKAAKCPRISAEDLIELAELKGSSPSRSPTKKSMNSKPKILIIDVRSLDEYNRGTLPGSLSIPFETAFSPEGDLVPSQAVQILNNHRSQVKVIIGGRGKNATNFAGELVRLSYPRVCILHKGMEVLKPTGLLTVPPADI